MLCIIKAVKCVLTFWYTFYISSVQCGCYVFYIGSVLYIGLRRVCCYLL
jgi:hypothetical protein